jgi:hypothetical protein
MQYIVFAGIAIISAIIATLIVNKITFLDNRPTTKWILDVSIFFAVYFAGLATFEYINSNKRLEEQGKKMAIQILNNKNLEIGAVEILDNKDNKILWRIYSVPNSNESVSQIYFCRSSLTNDGLILTSCSQTKTSL